MYLHLNPLISLQSRTAIFCRGDAKWSFCNLKCMFDWKMESSKVEEAFFHGSIHKSFPQFGAGPFFKQTFQNQWQEKKNLSRVCCIDA